MIFICSFLSFQLFMCSECQYNSEYESNSVIDYLYFMENERFHLPQEAIAIPFHNQEDLQAKLQNSTFFLIAEKYQDLHLVLDENSTLLTFLRNQGQYIDMCVQQQQMIDCQIRINNTLYDDGLIISELITNKIFFPSNSCNNAYFIENSDLLLINCHNSLNQLQYFILNDKSEILDEIKIDITQNCQYDTKFQFNKIFINSVNCTKSIILMIEIIHKDKNTNFDRNFTKLHELYNNLNQSNLINLKVCDSQQILLIYTNLINFFNLKNEEFTTHPYSYQPWFIYFKSGCFPYIYNKRLSIEEIQKYERQISSIINEKTQIKEIQQYEDTFIFLFEDQVVLVYDVNFNQSILNVKQIQKLNTLPFFVTLSKNNQISIHEIICQKPIIKYQQFPFLAILEKKFYRYYEQLFQYYSVSQYLIKYPLQIQVQDNFNITRENSHNNTFQFDTDMLVQPVPLYFELYQNQCKTFIDITNEYVINHHIKLPIKRILKLISFENNSVIIIYENLNGRIFLNLKHNKYQMTKFVMSATLELQVEFQRLNQNQVLIYFITSNQIITYKCIDYTDLIFNKVIETKNKIKECKFDSNKIICLFSDYTLIAQQNEIWFDYHLPSKIKIQDWVKNEEIKYNDFRVPYIQINYQKHLIELIKLKPLQNNVCVSAHGQILHSYIFVTYNRILLVVRQDEQISLNLYFFDINYIYFLYQMPTYQFQIVYPLKIKFKDKLFAIITTKNSEEYLFTYDISQQGRTCLRSINKMYQNYNDFDLIDNTGIYSQQFTDRIIITYPILSISVSNYNQSDYAQIEYPLKFQVKSFIESVPSDLSISLYLTNDDRNLRYKFNAENQPIQVKNNEIMNLDSIYGNINNLQLKNDCNGYLQEPIQVTQTLQLNCWRIKNKFCFLSKYQFIYDFFRTNQSILLPQNYVLLNPSLITQKNIFIIYNHLNTSFAIFNLSEYLPTEQDLLKYQLNQALETYINLDEAESFIIVNDKLIVFFQDLVIIHELIGLKYQYQLDMYIHSQKQFEFVLSNDISDFYISLSSSKFILIIYQKNTKQMIQNQQFNTSFQIEAFYILHSEIKNQEIQINIILFSLLDKAYIYELIFNVDGSSLLCQSQKQKIRYQNIYFQNFKKLTENIYILKGMSQEQISSYYLYKIDQSQQTDLIDYYYKYEQDEDIDQYNQTHFIQINKNDNENIIKLVVINNYKAFIKDDCGLILNNDVSNLTIIIEKESDTTFKKQSIFYLVIINFLLILLLNHKKRNRKMNFTSNYRI